MFTVLLADDEDSVLEVLKCSIHWQELGVDKLLTAPDGMAALELFEQQQIDLLVTDIRMPRMDGLELIQKVRSISPDTHCILLTAYGEFEYAKQAIRLGVENYLLKPVVKEEVEQNVQTALNNIYQKRKNSESLLLENTLRRWATGMIGDEELSERAAVLDIDLYQCAYCVLCFVKRARGSMAMLRAACAEEFGKNYAVNAFWDEKGRYVMILGGKAFDTEKMAQTLTTLAEEYQCEHIAAIAIGSPVGQTENVRLSYQTACETIELSDLKTAAVVLSSEPARQDPQNDLLAEELRVLFYLPTEEERLLGYKHLAHKQAKRQGSSYAKILQACIRVMTEEFPLEGNLQEKVYSAAPQESADSDFETQIVAALQAIYVVFAHHFSAFSPVVQRTVQYIRSGVLSGQGVSLKEFCAQTGMNPAYLGHEFKEETGLFFNDYLTRCRIERAIILMRNPNRMIKDVAEEVGFTYTSYFVKCFRKQKSVSPTEYRQKMLEMQ